MPCWGGFGGRGAGCAPEIKVTDVVSGHEFKRRPRSRYPSVLQDGPMMSIAKNKVRVLLSKQEAHALSWFNR